MKQSIRWCVTVVALAVATTVQAATLEWAVDGFAVIYQVVADGKGGCAVLGAYPGGPCVVWIDSSGAKVYDRTLTTSSLGILAFDGKNLVYHLATSPMTLVTVDKKGAERTVSDPAYHMYGTYVAAPYQPSRAGDKKGFFTAQAPTGAGTWRVARYSYK